MMSRIAILGWGSLLWDVGQEFDQWHEPWDYDGPSLKLEFSRVSNSRSKALTLVIDSEHGLRCSVAWCLSKRNDPQDAVCDLRSREGTTLQHIGRVFLQHPEADRFRDGQSHQVIVAWAKSKQLDIVLWTDLQNNFQENVGSPFSIQAALTHIKALPPEGKLKAAEYVWRAPDFIRTPLREALQREPWFSEP